MDKGNNFKQVSAKISTYTADVSGVCSALFELGGMTVIHDPSGCNSTYNTHDEPRWYDQDSLVFISGLTQMDAILGNDEKFIRDIIRAAKDLKPRFISLVRTPVPLMSGTDFEGIAAEIEARSGIPTFWFPTTGMQTYVRGVGMALETIAERIPICPPAGDRAPIPGCPSADDRHRGDFPAEDAGRPGVNITGATPLDFSVGSTMDSLRKWIRDKGFRLQACMAMGSSPEEVSTAGKADLTLVISSAGLPAAKVLKRRFGIPYVIGFPAGEYGDILAEKMRALCPPGPMKADRDDFARDLPANVRGLAFKAGDMAQPCVIIGEAVTSISIARALQIRTGVRADVICPLETDPEIVSSEGLTGPEIVNAEGLTGPETGSYGTGKPGVSGESCNSCDYGVSGQSCNSCDCGDPGESGDSGDICFRQVCSEGDLMQVLKDYKTVIADPLYRPVCPKEAGFIFLPHEAFSGRIYRSRIPDLVHIFG